MVDTQAGRDLLERVQIRLKDLIEIGALASRERVECGNTLATLGDPRFDQDLLFLPNEPMKGFVEIPSGKFLMGSQKGDVEYNEQPQHELELPTYWLGKYPVTVAQFSAFVKVNGYEPRDANSLNGISNHPVGNVTWYDALAYCKWLGEQLSVFSKQKLEKNDLDPEERSSWKGLADSKLHVSLPSEAEWEKAARGKDDRRYPWQGTFDPDKANTGKTNIGKTSAVGCFPGGQSPFGLLDMSGNVWEWTRSLWGKGVNDPAFNYPYQPGKEYENLDAPREVLRVFRGGSFMLQSSLARCSFRRRSNPAIWHGYYGFRVVVSPLY